MMKSLSLRIFGTLLAAALASAACNPFAIVPSTQVPPTPIVESIPAPTEVPTGASPAPTVATGPVRFMVFHQQEKVVTAHDVAGNIAYRIPTPGLEYPHLHNSSVVDGAVYYISVSEDHAIMRASVNEAVRVNVPTDRNTYSMSVSPDDKLIAWSSFYGAAESAHSTLWIANTDGSNMREALTYTVQQSSGQGFAAPFDLVPLGWTGDGKLLFDRAISGVGGYILFFGSNSLYRMDPNTLEIETIVPAEENHDLSLDTYRLDLGKVVFNTRGFDTPITIRNLQDQSEVTLPKIGEQGLGGSVKYSPSGQWIAYAVARSNSEDEAGDVVVVPGDLSAGPAAILHVGGNRAPYIRGWLDEDTILFTTSSMDGANQVWSIGRDGSKLTQLAEGMFFGMMP